MRISDWSSDVCSSDLVLRIGQQEVNLTPFLSPHEDPPRRRDGIGWATGPRASAGIAWGGAGGGAYAAAAGAAASRAREPGGGLRREIGRASCRERVCQYV